jgi:hypothetical protein
VRHATKQELRSKRRRGKPQVAKHQPFDNEDRERFVRTLRDLLTASRDA